MSGVRVVQTHSFYSMFIKKTVLVRKKSIKIVESN